MKKVSKYHQLLACAMAVILLAASCKQKKEEAKVEKEKVCITDSLARMIAYDTARVRNIDDEVKLSGEVNFNDNKVVKIFPFSSGQVTEVKATLGDHVVKGQVLAVVRSADVAGNYSDLSSAGNDLAIAKRQMDNTASLFRNGIASEKDFQEAKENYNKAATAEEKVRQNIRINGGGQTSADGTYLIRSPVTGYVVEKKIEPGGFIRSDNSDNLFTVGDISEVWIWANVYETDISKVHEGNAAEVTTVAYSDTVFRGVVDKVNQQLDPVTKVMKIRVRLANASGMLKPEMFARVTIRSRENASAVCVPLSSVVSDYGKDFVVIHHDRCNLELRQVQLLKKVDNCAYIASGVQDGEVVISKNQLLLYRALLQ
jgi:membrane fusion protein, heavy metal efflux system